MSLMQQKDIKKYDLTCIEICVSGSAPFPTEALRRWVSMTHASITEGFGLTEASPCVTANPLDGPQKEGSIGVAFPHTEIRIVDINDSNHVLGPNEEGEMLVRGPQVMQGYWNRPEETKWTRSCTSIPKWPRPWPWASSIPPEVKCSRPMWCPVPARP